MKYYPINYNVAGRKVLVVGGGGVAQRKVEGLRACGARVTVVSPEFSAALVRMTGVRRLERRYRKSDLRGACLVISATDSAEVNARVFEQASAAGIPVNVVDQPDLCTFTVPATISRGDLVITISTGGGSPALSRRIRERLETSIEPAYAKHLALLQQMRPVVQAAPLTDEARIGLLKRMAGDEVFDVVAGRGTGAARRLLRNMLAQEVAGAAGNQS